MNKYTEFYNLQKLGYCGTFEDFLKDLQENRDNDILSNKTHIPTHEQFQTIKNYVDNLDYVNTWRIEELTQCNEWINHAIVNPNSINITALLFALNLSPIQLIILENQKMRLI